MRCPECLKLYFADPHEVSGSRPKFQCQNCQMRFWVAYPESLNQGEVLGYPLNWDASDESNDPESQSSSKISCKDDKVFQAFEKVPCGDKDEENDHKGIERVVESIPMRAKPRSEEEKVGRSFFSRLVVSMGLFCAILVAVGVTITGFRNLVGLGVAGLFLSIVIYRFFNE